MRESYLRRNSTDLDNVLTVKTCIAQSLSFRELYRLELPALRWQAFQSPPSLIVPVCFYR